MEHRPDVIRDIQIPFLRIVSITIAVWLAQLVALAILAGVTLVVLVVLGQIGRTST